MGGAQERLGLGAGGGQRTLRLRADTLGRGLGGGARGRDEAFCLAARAPESRVRLRTRRAGDRLGLGPGPGDDGLGLGTSLLVQALDALVRCGERGGGLFLHGRQARLRLVRGLRDLPALLLELLLGLRRPRRRAASSSRLR